MTEAWMVRGGQQQNFIEQLFRKVTDWADEQDNYEESVFTALITANVFLFSRLHFPEMWGDEKDPTGVCPLIESCWQEVVTFSRVPEEQPYLFWKLIEKIYESVSCAVTRPYQKAESDNPQAVYHAPSAMTEIEE